uniref:Uncharacterized protein n=1 Tax=Caenorhabditis japonica TaxID=281687 RepID=A0A8R1DZA0_CAEJA
MMAHRSDSLMDQVFSAVTLPTVGQTTITESHHEESHAVFHSESYRNVSQHEHVEYTHVEEKFGKVVGHEVDDQRSEVSAVSKATSVSVHSSVSQKSAQHYDFPPIQQYDLPPIGDVVVGKGASVASIKPESHNSVVSHHSNHSSHSAHSAHTHDSESTITEATLVNAPIIVGNGVGVESQPPTPLAVGQSSEHDAVIVQFKNLHGKAPSVVSSVVPNTNYLPSDSEDSVAPSKLTHSIAVGEVVGSQNQINTLKRSHDLSYTDLIAPVYYQPPSVQGAFDARSEDSFGFEKVEYVESSEQHPGQDHVKQVVHDQIIEQQTYEPYHIVHENHNVPSVDFNDDQHSTIEHEHHDSHVTHNFTSNVKQSRSNSASTYQSRHLLAQHVGPKITEELRPSVVREEDETHVEPPVMAYVAPIPIKPPRTHEQNHVYNAYETEVHYQHTEVVKSTTILQDDIRSGSEGVSALRAKFEHGAPPPLAPVLDVKKYDHQDTQSQHNYTENTVVEQVHIQVGKHFTTVENHYDVPFESREKSSYSSLSSSSEQVEQPFYDVPVIENLSHLPVYYKEDHRDHYSSHLSSLAQRVYDSPVVENLPHSPAFYKDDQHHHYVPQIKVITEYRHINPRHHYVETRVKNADGHNIAKSPQLQSVNYFKEIDRVHHYVPSTPTLPEKEVRQIYHHHTYVPNGVETKRESRSVERVHHYLPEQPIKVENNNPIIRNHHYVPLEKRSQSTEPKIVHPHHNYVPIATKNTSDENYHQANKEHQYVPPEIKHEIVKAEVNHEHHYVPLVQKSADEPIHVSREHNYIPLKVEKTRKSEAADFHNQYVSLSTKTEVKTFDVGRSHSYIPLEENTVNTKPQILREHKYVPHVEKKVAPSQVINREHNYLPAHSNVASPEKIVISQEHSFVPLANKIDEAPRHSNNLSHHHYVPLPTKRNEATATGDKIGHEHHYFPLAPKTEQVSVHSGQQHQYSPLVTKSSDQQVSSINRQHQYIPYLPPVTHAEQKEAVKLYEHQYVPLPPKQDSHVSHAGEKPPQLPREHHYYPLAIRTEEKHQKTAHDQHQYIPPIDQRQPQPQQHQDRQHGYLPIAQNFEKPEQTNGYDRNHHYVPVVSNVKNVVHHTQENHHYAPQASPRKHVTEVNRSHNYFPVLPSKDHQSRHEQYHSHTYLPPSSQNSLSHQSPPKLTNHSFVPQVPLKERKNEVVHEHGYLPPVKDVEVKKSNSIRKHEYIPATKTTKSQGQTDNSKHSYQPSVPRSASHEQIDYNKHGYVPRVSHLQDGKKTDYSEHDYLPSLPRSKSRDQVDHSKHGYLPSVQRSENIERANPSEHTYLPLMPRSKSHEHVDHSKHVFVPSVKQHQSIGENANHSKHGYVPTIKTANNDFLGFEREHRYVPETLKKDQIRQIHHDHHFVPSVIAAKNDEKIDYKEHHYVPTVQKVNGITSNIEHRHNYVETVPEKHDIVERSIEHHYVPPVPKQTDNHQSSLQKHNYVPTLQKLNQTGRADIRHHNYVPNLVKSQEQKSKNDQHHYVPQIAKQKEIKLVDHEQHHYVPTVYQKDVSEKIDREHKFTPSIIRKDDQKTVEISKHHFVPSKKVSVNTHNDVVVHHGYVPNAPKKEVIDHAQLGHHYVPQLPQKDIAPDYDHHHHYIPSVQSKAQRTSFDSRHHYIPPSKKTSSTTDQIKAQRNKVMGSQPENQENQGEQMHYIANSSKRTFQSNFAVTSNRNSSLVPELSSATVYTNSNVESKSNIPDEPPTFMLKNRRTRQNIIIPAEPSKPIAKPRSITSPPPEPDY